MSWKTSADFTRPILSVKIFDLFSSLGLWKLQETIELEMMLALVHIWTFMEKSKL